MDARGAGIDVEAQHMNGNYKTWGDGMIAVAIASLVLCAIAALGAYASSRPCDFDRTPDTKTLCRGGGD